MTCDIALHDENDNEISYPGYERMHVDLVEIPIDDAAQVWVNDNLVEFPPSGVGFAVAYAILRVGPGVRHRGRTGSVAVGPGEPPRFMPGDIELRIGPNG